MVYGRRIRICMSGAGVLDTRDATRARELISHDNEVIVRIYTARESGR